MGSDHAQFINETLTKYHYVPWKICVWHKNQAKLQTGDKNDETGYQVYGSKFNVEACRIHGAMVVTSHEHSYERSHLLSSFENQTIVSKSNTLNLSAGHSFVAVSGLGGESIRYWYNDNEKNPWWAATAALDNGVNYGALLCKFRHKGDPLTAQCKMVDIDGVEWDKFKITTQSGQMPPDLTVQSWQSPSTGFAEVAIQQSFDLTSTNLESGQTRCGEQVLVFSAPFRDRYLHTLSFRLDVSHLMGHRIKSVHLQMMGSHPLARFVNRFPSPQQARQLFEGSPMRLYVSKMTARPTCEHISSSNAIMLNPTGGIHWQGNGTDFEVGEVWVSPDLSSLFDSVIDTPEIEVTLGLQGQVDLEWPWHPAFDTPSGLRGVYGLPEDLGTCVAPTLAISTMK